MSDGASPQTEMTPERWRQVKDFLANAIGLPLEDRGEYVAEVCGSDSAMRAELESLIAAHESAEGGALEKPAFDISCCETLASQMPDRLARRRASSDEVRSTFLESPLAVGLAKGTRLGEYEVQSLLGSGGMGEVYRALDLRLRREVAIKILPGFASSDAERLRRFEQEAMAAAALNHPNILAVFHMGTHEFAPYLVSELLEGETLRELIKRGRVVLPKVIDYGVQIAHGLAAAHEKGIVHRDVKPENLFVTREERLKILDFGLAKLTQPRPSQFHSALIGGSRTEPGMVMGTVCYMSPEQVQAESPDHRTDIFSFGTVLYEMLTGQRAFQGPTSVETMEAILNEEPPPVSQLAPSTPPALQRVVDRCLEKNPEHRFQSAADLGFALEELSDFLSGTIIEKQVRTRHQLLRTLVGLALAGLVVFAILATLRSYRERGSYPWRPDEQDIHSTKLTESDTIVLAEFDNKTGEAVFDDALNQALAIQLEQSPFLKILPNSKIGETLKLMMRSPGEHLTDDIAKEVCIRSGCKAVLQGSISKLGNEYLLGLRGTACLSGDKLTESQGEANSKEAVLKTLSAMAAETRTKLGESLASVQKFDYQKVTTTSSLEALKAYSMGKMTLAEHGTDAAIPFFKRAIELDPNFAKAYVALAKMYGNNGEFDLAAENATNAFNLRDRVSEEERFDITSQYHAIVTGDLDQAHEAYDAWIRAYPRESMPLHNRANILRELGQHEQALEGFWASLRLEPHFAYGYTSAAWANIALNRLDDAKSALGGLKRNGLEPEIAWNAFYIIAFLRNDAEEMDRQLQFGLGDQQTKSDALREQASTEAYHGRLARTRELVSRATQLQNQPGLRNVAAEGAADLALELAVCGDESKAKSAAISALSRGTSSIVRAKAALALAETRELVHARALVAELEKAYPLHTMLNRYWIPTIRASIQIKQGDPKLALSTLEPTLDSELGRGALYPAYIRGLAYSSLKTGSKAAAEFQKLLDHPGIVCNNPVGALAHLQLGRAYKLSGDTQKAKAAYEDFFALWKDADSDLPILKEAKQEYARLTSSAHVVEPVVVRTK